MSSSIFSLYRFSIINRGQVFFRLNLYLSLSVFFLIFILTQNVFADETTTQSVWDHTPQDFLAHLTNDRLAVMTVDQVMSLIGYFGDTNNNKASAKLMAIGIINGAKLELAVRTKWGKLAETAVARTLGDSVPDDIAKAKWKFNGHFATATFQADIASPVNLVERNGHWKFDLDTYRIAAGDNALLDKNSQASNVVLERLIQELAKIDASVKAHAFAKHVQEEMEKLSAPN